MQKTTVEVSDKTLEDLHQLKKTFGFSSLDKTIQEMILMVKVYTLKAVGGNVK